jgi:hypothetical protein
MPIFEKEGERLAFIHIPKAAGSSIERYFTDLGWKMTFWRVCTNPHSPSEQHFTYSKLQDRVQDLDDIPSFCVVRDPFQRIVSEWRWQRDWMKNTMLSFSDFVRRVDMSLRVSKTYWDNHWRPQSDFVSDKINQVIRMENLKSEFGAFLEMHGLDSAIELPQINRSKKSARSRLRSNPTPETIERITRIYRDDFENFGYSLEEGSRL